MAGPYDGLIAAAKRIITAKGGTATLTGPVPVTPDVSEPWKATATGDPAPTATAPAVVLPLDRDGRRTLQMLTGSDIVRAQVYALIAGADLPVVTNLDTFTFAGDAYRIVAIDTYKPDGVSVILHIVWLER